MKKPPPAQPRPRPTGEAARDPHVKPTARTRHAVGNAAQRERPDHGDRDGRDREGGDWLAERFVPPPHGKPTEDTP